MRNLQNSVPVPVPVRTVEPIQARPKTANQNGETEGAEADP